MALTPEQIDGLRARMEDIAQPIIDGLLADLAERVAEAGKMTSTAAYEAYRAKALGASERELKKFLKQQLGISNREVRRLMRAAARFSSEDDFDRVGVWATEAQRESLEQMTQAAIQLATKDFENLTQTLGMVDCITGRPLPLQDAYRQAMDFAFEQIFTGAADYETAIRQATRKLADRGVVAIDYASGVSTELGAAVRRNMMGGMGLLVEQITQENHDALGCDGWEISAHAASAPDHEPYQGRQYSDAEYTRLNESLKRRIGTLNCGHYPSPIILGVNSPQYTEAELEEFRRANAEGITYEGRHYTAYEATQRRNRFESAIRRQKRRVLVSEKNGDADQLLADRIKLTRLNQEYGKFCKAADLKTRPQRLQQDGFGRRQAAQAGAAGQKYSPAKRSSSESNAAVRSEYTLQQKNRGKKVAITDIAVDKVPKVSFGGISEEMAGTVQQAHKDLLKFSKEQNDSNEVAGLLDLTTGERLPFVKGNNVEVNIEADADSYHWMRTMPERSIMLMHNHPGQSYFSMNDISVFMRYSSIRTMSIVTNQGKVWQISKTSKFNFDEAKASMVRAIAASDGNKDQAIEVFLKECYNYGVERGG